MKTKLVLVFLFAFTSSALADDTKDAQKKVDDAKVKSCESTKASIVKNEARCPQQASEAKAITCTAADFKKMADLLKACLSAPLPPQACKVLDAEGKATLVELPAMEAAECRTKGKEAAIAKLCTPELKGKSVKYKIQRGEGTPLPGFAICK